MHAQRLQLFEYAVLFHPDTSAKVASPSKLYPEKTVLLSRDVILAADQNAANMRIIAEIDKEYLEHAERLVVALRPF